MRLRLALRLNAAFSTLTGIASLAAASAIADLLGVGEVLGFNTDWVIRATGLGLLGFAAFLVFLAGTDADRLHRESLSISLADFGWVLGTGVLLALGLVERGGAILLGVVAVVVLDLGLMQLSGRRRLGATRPQA